MSSVSRSVYQKLKEENKRLIHDIYVLTMQKTEVPSAEKILTIEKWRMKFTQDEEFNAMLREILTAKKP